MRSLQEKLALSMEKDCKESQRTPMYVVNITGIPYNRENLQRPSNAQ
jgi:hypothetical protein